MVFLGHVAFKERAEKANPQRNTEEGTAITRKTDSLKERARWDKQLPSLDPGLWDIDVPQLHPQV